MDDFRNFVFGTEVEKKLLLITFISDLRENKGHKSGWKCLNSWTDRVLTFEMETNDTEGQTAALVDSLFGESEKLGNKNKVTKTIKKLNHWYMVSPPKESLFVQTASINQNEKRRNINKQASN